MKNNLQTKISLQAISTLIRLPLIVSISGELLGLSLLLLSYIIKNDIVRILLLSAATSIFVISISIILVLPKSVNLILTEQLDLDKYLAYFDYIDKHGFKTQKKNYAKLNTIAHAQVAFFKGEFSKSLQLLDSLNTEKWSPSLKKKLMPPILKFKILNHIHLKQIEEIDELFSKLKSYPKTDNLIEDLQTIKSIMLDEGSFEELPTFTTTKLGQIQTNYYKAYSIKQSEPEKAKQLFENIVEENNQLFYVKEAEEYLKEAK